MVKIRNRNMVRDSSGNMMVMGRNMAVLIMDEQGNERAVHRVTYGSRLLVDDGDTVKQGQRVAEWDPYTRPILTPESGIVEFEDLVDGVPFPRAPMKTPVSSNVSLSTGGPILAVLISNQRL